MKRTGLLFAGLLLFSMIFLILYSYAYQMSRPVPFEDENLEAAIREILDKPGEDMTVSHLRGITEVAAVNKGITSLEGMQYMRNLRVLDLEDNFVDDVSPLKDLDNLEVLNLRNNEITSLEEIHLDSLSSLENLRVLSLRHNVRRPDPEERSYQYRIEDIEILGKFTMLEELSLRDNHIQDAAPLENLVHLRDLDLSQNPIKNGELFFLDNLTKLEELNLRETGVRDIAFLESMEMLTYLNLHSNPDIQDVSPIGGLTKLQTLIIPNVHLGENIEVIGDLSALQRLNVRNTGIEDLSVLAALMEQGALQDHNELDKEATVDLAENPIPLEKEGERGGYAPIREYWANVRNRIPENLLTPKTQELYINEFMASNGKTIGDADGNFNDWIEIYNPKEESVQLEGYYLSDDLENPTRWAFPDMKIDPKSHILVWASGEDRVDDEGMAHTNFSIDRQGEPLILTAPDGEEIIDFIAKREVPRDISFGRAEDGSGELQYFENPTPGTRNLPAAPYYINRPPTFSREGGFYQKPFDLTLTSEEHEQIYYTLDGSTPTENSILYEAPIPILETMDAAEEFPRATVIRAKAFSENREPSKVVTQSYFVGADVFEQFSFPVISLNTDADHLFDEETGIYAENHLFDEESGSDVENNYDKRGREWERPVAFEIYEPNGALGLRQDLGIRIHGGATRSYAQKSLRLYARGVYDDADVMEYEFFPELKAKGGDWDIQEFHRLILRNSGNDWSSTMFRDAFIQSLVEDIDTIPTQAFRPSVVFINGEYWGIYNLRERQDEYYFKSHFGVDPENITVLENRKVILDKGSPKGESHYHDMLKFIEDVDLRDEQHFQEIEKLMDVDNYLDYFIAQIYFANTDWPQNNIRFWRYNTEETPEDSKHWEDGRWRWIMVDTDFGFGRYTRHRDDERFSGIRQDTIEWVLSEKGGRWEDVETNFLFRNMMKNTGFQNEFIKRSVDYQNTFFHSDRVLSRIDGFQKTYADEIGLQLMRWGRLDGSIDNWKAEVDILREFAEDRPAYVMKHLDRHFQLGEQFQLNVDFEQHDQGTVLVNDLDIFMFSDSVDYKNPWEGHYFKSLPIEVKAEPRDGYRFVGWGGDEFEETEILTIEEDTLLKPKFEPSEGAYYDDYVEDIRKAKILNYSLSYLLALFFGILGVWTLKYFSPAAMVKGIKILVYVLLILGTVQFIPLMTSMINTGLSAFAEALSFRLLIFCFAIGGFIGLHLPQQIKEIRVFEA